jgi:transcriptional regulator with XRE-family HTH domain
MKEQDKRPNEKLKRERELRGWSQRKIAERVGTAEQVVARWEGGLHKPNRYFQTQLCELFGKNAEELGFLLPASDAFSHDAPAQEAGSKKKQERQESNAADEEREDKVDELRRLLLQCMPSIIIMPKSFIEQERWKQVSTIATKSAIITHETSLRYFEQLIKGCWDLLRTDGLLGAEQFLFTYLPTLERIAQQPSQNQKAFACLASQGYILAGLVAVLQTNFVLAEVHCELAVQYSRLSGERDLEIASLKHLATKFFDAHYPQKCLDTYQEALSFVDEVSPLLRSRTYLGLALAHAQCRNKQEALRCLGLAQDTFPQYPEDDPSFPFADCGLSSLNHYAGLIYLEFDQAREAWNSFAGVEILKEKTAIPERTIIEIVNCQAEAAVAQREMELACTHVRAGVIGAMKLGSEKRFHEAFSVYKQMRCLWSKEQQVKDIAELFHR